MLTNVARAPASAAGVQEDSRGQLVEGSKDSQIGVQVMTIRSSDTCITTHVGLSLSVIRNFECAERRASNACRFSKRMALCGVLVVTHGKGAWDGGTSGSKRKHNATGAGSQSQRHRVERASVSVCFCLLMPQLQLLLSCMQSAGAFSGGERCCEPLCKDEAKPASTSFPDVAILSTDYKTPNKHAYIWSHLPRASPRVLSRSVSTWAAVTQAGCLISCRPDRRRATGTKARNN